MTKTPKYQFITVDMKDGRIKTIAIASYAKKSVRGVAVCSPEDKYVEEFGRELAKARCDAKIAKKRFQNAMKKYDESQETYHKAIKDVHEAMSYYDDSYHAWRTKEREVSMMLFPPTV